MTQSTTEFTEIPGLDGVSVVRHSGDSPTGARHMHDSLCVGAVLSGRRALQVGAARHEAGPGDVLVVPPGLAHSCPRTGPCEYVVVCVPVARLADLGLAPPVAAGVAADDPALFGAVRRMADVPARAASQLERQAMLLDAVSPLCREPGNEPHPRLEPERVAEVRRFLEERCAEDVPLAELARLAGCSPCRLNRVFARTVGMPPHQYQSLQRVRRVKECIRSGRSLAESAAEAGFADQSHMSRCFRKIMGMTPGTFERGLAARQPE